MESCRNSVFVYTSLFLTDARQVVSLECERAKETVSIKQVLSSLKNAIQEQLKC
jgi:hypothetical protein